VKHFRTIAAAGFLAAAILPAAADDISGAGATFPYPIYAKWADTYKKETGVGLNYQSIGSGGGIKQITARTVTFGASDMPLKVEQLDKDGLVQWPMVMGAPTHACGHLLADAGHDTRRLQLWMGHSDIKHTARYSELSTKPFKDFWR